MLNPISSARSGEPYGFFWTYTESGVTHVCAWNGGSFVRTLRSALRLPVSDVWDADLQQALIAVAQGFVGTDSAWAPVVTYLRNDLATQIVSLLSVQFALYFLIYRAAGKRFDLIGIAPTTILPAWGVPPAPADLLGFTGHTTDELICFVPNVDPPPPLPPSQTQAAVLASQAGVRAGRSTAAPPEIVRGISNEAGGLILLGLGVVFAGGVWWFTRTRKNPSDAPTAKDRLAGLYSRMLAADAEFTRALRKEYRSMASDMRYRTQKQTAEIRALGKDFDNAAAEFFAAKNSYRGR